MPNLSEQPPTLETLAESGWLGVEVLHPGGLELTRELAEHCRIKPGLRVLDVASGRGTSACFLAEEFGCEVVGIDASEDQVECARKKLNGHASSVEFLHGDAHHLPFDDDSFDAVISEAVTCYLDKEQAISEMLRVVKPNGYIGIHDLWWREDTPDAVKAKFAEVENERPETQQGWVKLFEQAGLSEVETVDKTAELPRWFKDYNKQMGFMRQLTLLVRIFLRWGVSGYQNIRASQRIIESEHAGYGILVGRKPGH